MLILQPTKAKGPQFWRRGAAYCILRDAAEIGRIDISGTPKRDGEAQITLREQVFDCRIHITGRAHWTWVESRWLMYSEGAVLHGATWEGGRKFLTEAESGQPPLLLRKSTFGSFAIERASDQVRVGEIKRIRARLLPKPVVERIVLDMSIDLQETFEVMLLWVAVQDEYRSDSG
jgi:hypothetical protein